jgi:hypothetical protein
VNERLDAVPEHGPPGQWKELLRLAGAEAGATPAGCDDRGYVQEVRVEARVQGCLRQQASGARQQDRPP